MASAAKTLCLPRPSSWKSGTCSSSWTSSTKRSTTCCRREGHREEPWLPRRRDPMEHVPFVTRLLRHVAWLAMTHRVTPRGGHSGRRGGLVAHVPQLLAIVFAG